MDGQAQNQISAGGEADKVTGEIKFKPKGKGSFWISREAIGVLLDKKATAMQIVSYLVLAKHTEESGKLSTSGIKAIHKATGVSHMIGEKAVEALKGMDMYVKDYRLRPKADKLVYTAEDWGKLTGEVIPPAPFERAAVRYVLNPFNTKPENKVWFSNELITGVGKFTQPLRRLKMCGDVAARLLLIGYRDSNLEQYGGINPSSFHHKYEMSEVKKLDGYDIWHGKSAGNTGASDWIKATGYQDYKGEDKISKASEIFFRAIDALDGSGFVYQMVSVMDRESGNDEAQVIYELDAKSKHGYKPKGEEGLAGIIAKLAAALGNPVTDSAGRFYDKYAAIVQSGIQPHIIGIYRLRFRVSNTKNHGVTSAWARIHQGQRETGELLADLAKRNGINLAPKRADDVGLTVPF